jgi:hypothetical protein
MALQPVQVLGRNVAGDVDAIEAGGFHAGQRRIHVHDRLLQRLDVLVDQAVGRDLAADFLDGAAVGDQLVAGRHVDAVHVRVQHRRRSRSEEHLAGAGFARHLHDLAAGGAAHDRVVDQQHVLVLEFGGDGVELLAHRLPAHALPRHDEGAADVAVLDEAFAVLDAQLQRQLDRGRARGIRNRHHDVDFFDRDLQADLVGQVFTHAQAGRVDRGAVDHGVRPRQVHVFEGAGVQRRVLGALARMQLAGVVDEDGFARRDVAHEAEAQALERHRFAGDQVFRAILGFVHAQAQRTDAERVAEGQQAVAGDLGDHGIGAAHALVHHGDRLEHGFLVERIAVGGGLDFVGQHVQQDFRIGTGVDVTAVDTEQLILELGLVGQVAVVRQRDAERRIDVERLRFLFAGRTGGRIAAVADAGITHQRAHVTGTEHVAHQAVGLVHREHAAVVGCDTGRILAAVLQQQQCVVQQLVNGGLRDDADDATHGALLKLNSWVKKIQNCTCCAKAAGKKGLTVRAPVSAMGESSAFFQKAC